MMVMVTNLWFLNDWFNKWCVQVVVMLRVEHVMLSSKHGR